MIGNVCKFLYVLLTIVAVSCYQQKDYKPKAVQTVPQKAFLFNSGQVKLQNGPFKESQQAEGKYLLSLNEDRLLAPFLREAGLTPKDSIYGGWEANVLPGVALSFYLSGLSRMYMATEEKIYLEKISYALEELDRCQAKTGGYLLGVRDGIKIFERVKKEGCFSGFGEWNGGHATPFYSLEKLMSGLRDVYRVCHIKKALIIWEGLGVWLCDLMAQIPDKELHKMMKIEYGGMNWVLSDLFADTNDKRFLEMSKRWQDSITVIPCIHGHDPLTNVHANMQFPKFSGLAARYPYSGNREDLDGARFFWEQVVYHRSYATGGNSESEFFCPADSMANRLTPFTEENCNEYNMLRLTSLLYQIDPKVEYSDYQERILYNHTLASQNPSDGKVVYFLPLMSGAKKSYLPLYTDFACCVCSSMDHYTRHGEFIYAYDESSLYVNLFIASKVNWDIKEVTVLQETQFPFSEKTTLQIKCSGETEFALKIRNPNWLASAMSIVINGEEQTLVPVNGYYILKRKWHSGDKVLLKLPMALREESILGDKNKVALFYGPILLAARLEEREASTLAVNMLNPVLLAENKPIDEWLKPDGDSLQFICSISKPEHLIIKPLFMLKTNYHSVYWQKMTNNEFQQQKELLKDMDTNIAKAKNKTIDEVIVGDVKSEATHLLTGHSKLGDWPGNLPMLGNGKWRVMSDTLGFGYTMKMPKSGRGVLQCQFMGREPYETWNFSITVGKDTLLTKKREKDDLYPVVPYTMDIPLPTSLIKNDNQFIVHFGRIGMKKQGSMPRLLGLRVLQK